MTIQRRQENRRARRIITGRLQNIEVDAYQVDRHLLAQDIWARVVTLLPDPNEPASRPPVLRASS